MTLPSHLERYGLAVVAVGAALLYQLLLAPALDEPSPFLLFPLAVLSADWRGGLGPGLLTSTLALLSVDYSLIPPRLPLGPAEAGQAMRLGLFGLELLGITLLGAHGRRV